MKRLYSLLAYLAGLFFAVPGLLAYFAEHGTTGDEVNSALLRVGVGVLFIMSGQLAVQSRTLKIKTNKKD